MKTVDKNSIKLEEILAKITQLKKAYKLEKEKLLWIEDLCEEGEIEARMKYIATEVKTLKQQVEEKKNLPL